MRNNGLDDPESNCDCASEQPDVRTLYAGYLNPPLVYGHVTWVWHIPEAKVYYSPEWQRVLGDTDTSSLGPDTGGWWPRMHEDDVKPFVQAASDIVEGRTNSFRALSRVRRPDDSWVWLLSRGSVARRRDGRADIVLGVLMDVTELHSDTKFVHSDLGPGIVHRDPGLDKAPDLIMRMDRELNPLRNNPVIARLMSARGNVAANGTGDRDCGMEQEQRDFLRDNVKKVLDSGESIRETVSFPTRYGHEVTGEYSFWPEFDVEGMVTAVMLQFRDVTDQILAERRARLNEMRLEALYGLTQMDGASEEEVLRFVMSSLVGLTGSDNAFLFFPGRRLDDKGRMVWSDKHYDFLDEKYLCTDTFPPDLIRLARDKNGNSNYRVICNGDGLHPIVTAFDGNWRIIRYISAPVTDNGQVVCVAWVSNKGTDYREDDRLQLEAFINGAWLILRRHELVRELHRAKESAEKANLVKDEFLANISHELRTPLNGILGMLQLLDLSLLSPDQQEYIRTARYSGQALLRIISDILDFSRMSLDRLELRNDVFDFRLAVESCLGLFEREARRKGLEFSVQLDDNLPGALLGDDTRVMQIIFNIVGNALKFTESGGIRVTGSLRSRNGQGRVRIYLGVEDTGIGIAAEQLESVFGAFTQIDNSPTRRYPGAGLGLGIVRHLAGLMGGEVSIESEEGKGTGIHCSLAFLEPDDGIVAERAEGKVEHTPGSKPMNILVAEDDPASSFALRKFLQKAGHNPVCVSNGLEALEALRLYPFHCLFTDVQMPVMEGLEVIRRIRRNAVDEITPSDQTRALVAELVPNSCSEPIPISEHLPVVTISAHAMVGDNERFFEAGTDFYLSKPVDMKELLGVLGKVETLLSMQEKALTGTYIGAKQ